MGLTTIFTQDDCNRFIDHIVGQIISDKWIDLDKLALVAYGRDEDSTNNIWELGKSIIAKINRSGRTEKSLQAYYINLSGYYNQPCGKLFFPVFGIPDSSFVLLTDNINDGKLLRHADYFISKFGPKKEVRVASLVQYPNNYPFFDYISVRLEDNKLVHKEIRKRSSYVGCVVDCGADEEADIIKLMAEKDTGKFSFVMQNEIRFPNQL